MARGSHLSRGSRKLHMAQLHTVDQCRTVLNAAVVALVPYEALDTHWIECRTSSHSVTGGSVEECVWSGSRGMNATVPYRMPIGACRFLVSRSGIQFYWAVTAGGLEYHNDIPFIELKHTCASHLLRRTALGSMW